MDTEDTLCSVDAEVEPTAQTSGLLIVNDKQHTLEPGRVQIIGRGADCDIHLPYPCVSRHHAAIEIINGAHFLTDRASKFGTFRGNKRLESSHEYELSDGVQLKFGPECIATYKLVPIENRNSSFAKPQQIGRQLSNAVEINSPPKEFVMRKLTGGGDSEDTPADDGTLYLEPTQSDINCSLASLQNRSALRPSTTKISPNLPVQDSNRESEFSQNLVIVEEEPTPCVAKMADDDDDDDRMVTAVQDDLDGTDDTVDEEMDASDENMLVKVGEEIELQAATGGAGEAEDRAESAEVRSTHSDATDKTEAGAIMFSQAPAGLAEGASIHSSVHWFSSDVVKEGVRQHPSTPVRNDNEECLPEIEDEVPKASKAKGKRKAKVVDDDDEQEAGPSTSTKGRPGRKSKVQPAENDEKSKIVNKKSPPQVASPPTTTAANALVALQAKTAHSSVTGKESPPNEEARTKRNSRKSIRKKDNDEAASTSVDEDSKPKRAKMSEAAPEAKPSTSKASSEDPTEEESSSSRNAKKVAARRSIIPAREAKILVTGAKDNVTADMIRQIGATFSDSISDCTHLVVDGPARRTVKFVACVGHGIPVSGVNWLKQSVEARHLLEPEYFPPEGIQALETSQNFKLIETWQQTRKKRLLEGFSVYAMPKISKLTDADIKVMVKSAGGRLLTRPPKSFTENTVVIVGDGAVAPGSDQQAPPVLANLPDVGEFVALGIPLVSTEFLLAGILRYDHDPTHFPVEIKTLKYDGAADVPDAATKPSKSARSRRPKTAQHDSENKEEGESAAAEKPKKAAQRKTIKQKSQQQTIDES